MNFLKEYKHYIIGLILLLVIKVFLPATNGLTEIGVNMLAVLVPVIYLWITVATDWVSFLALAGIIISGVMSPTVVYQLSFGHFVIPMVISCMALNACLTKTGVTQRIASWFITRKIVHNRPYMFISMFYLSCFLLGLVLETATLTIIFLGLAKTICKDLGYEKGEPFYTVLMMGILWQGSITIGATPISHALPLILMGAVETAAGITISYTQWMSIGLPFAVLAFSLSLLIVKFLWKPDTSKFSNYDIEAEKSKSVPLGIEGKITAVLFVIVIALWIFPDIAGSLAPNFALFIKNIGMTVPPIITVALLCIIHIKGKPIAKFPEIVSSIPLGILVFTATVCVLGSAVSSETTGINIFLNNIISPLTQNMPPFMIVAFSLLGALVLTNFISNTVTMLLFYSLSVSLLAGSSINITGLVIMIGIMSCFAFLTPAAAVTTPLVFGDNDVTIKTTLKYNVVYMAIVYILSMILIWPLTSILL